jgi:chromosome segregation ATPase
MIACYLAWKSKTWPPPYLCRGSKVSVLGTTEGKGRIVAKMITVDGDDIESSQMIQAGLKPTADRVVQHEQALLDHQKQIGGNTQQIAANTADIETNQQQIAAHRQKIEQNSSDVEANTKRFTALADYDTKAEATLKFGSGSAKISADDM